MNIVFFTQEDPFYVKVFFDEFLRHYPHTDEIKAIVLSKTMGKKSKYKLAKQMFHFYGPFDFTRMGFKYTYAKLLGIRKVISNNHSKLPRTYTIRQLAEACGINVIERSDLNTESFQKIIKPQNADLFISVASPIIWKRNLIEIPRIGCINIHNAPLPRYRGMLPNFWQMYHGEKNAGITIHKIDVDIDTGDILFQKMVPLDFKETLDTLIRKTKGLGAQMMIEVIDQYKNGTFNLEKHKGEGSYFSFPTKEDVKKFKIKGYRIF